MSTITREQLHERAREKVKSLEFAVTQTAFADSRAELEEELELARIALASLEAEFVGEVSEQRDGLVMDGTVDLGGASTHRIIKGASKMKRLPLGTKFYTSPPAPANAEPVAWLWSHRKHPSEVSIVRPEDDERAEGAHWSGWSCQALYAAPPAPVSMKDHQIRELVNELRDIAVEYHGTQQLRERIARTVRAAMLQGAENAKSRCCNSPVIPDGLVMVPVEPTAEMQSAAAGAIRFDTTPINKLWTGNAVYRAMLAAAPQQEVK
ncbi:hypothetical protein [Enterobacter roggenkampii]|uniref:hypothetical protein n=1 Tax=Enterobacter roggenkampii TaxID=1812935 RepID=UPI00203265A0|nr:hypothetical protein [Enterobacter roggenkampii]WCF42172.1 hypothetical protein KK030_09135 [Enterobacter roggenkampii]